MHDRIRTFLRWLGMLFMIPFVVLSLPFMVLGIAIVFSNAMITGLFQRARWMRDLRRNGRVRPAAEMLSAAISGTLIVDRPGFDFKATQCWWTSENVIALSPVPIPIDADRIEMCSRQNETNAHEFDLWCWERYLSPETGSAILVTPPYHGEAMAATIRERHPALERVLSWSVIPSLNPRAGSTKA